MKEQLFHSMKEAVKHWWVSVLIGVIALVLGVWCLFTPDVTLVTLTYLFVIAFLLSGIFEIIFAVSNRKVLDGWGWTLASGIIDFLFGLLLMILPLPTIALVLIYFIGFWIMFRGMWMIGESFELSRMKVDGWGWFLALAILTLIFSFLFIISPLFSSVLLIAFFAVALLFYGVFRIYLGIQYRSIYKRIEKMNE